jgi:hypothetical protein
VFATAIHFHPSLIFAGKAGFLQQSNNYSRKKFIEEAPGAKKRFTVVIY